MTYSTNNPTRDQMIVNAIKKLEAREQPINLHTVTPRLPHGFELDLTELTGIMSNLHPAEVEFEEPKSLRHEWGPNNVSVAVERDLAELPRDPITGMSYAPPPKSLEKIEAPRAPEPEKLDHDGTPATPWPKISHAEAMAATQTAQRAILDNRITIRQLSERVRELRGKLHAATVAFVSGTQGTPEERRLAAARAYAATSQAERAKRLADVPEALRGKYGSAAAFTRKVMRNGPRRGALTEEQRARVGHVVPGSPAALAQAAARAAPKVT